MPKEKQIQPLYGNAYLQFLKAAASISEAWPQWIKGERDSGTPVASAPQHTELVLKKD
jgi:hypothetical protein